MAIRLESLIQIIVLCLLVIFTTACKDKNCKSLLSFYERNFNTIQVQDDGTWIANHEVDDDKLIFSFRREGNTLQEDGRLRIQKNFYEIDKNSKQIEARYEFKLTGEFTELNEDAEFDWLTILEIWHKPGWKNFKDPMRTSLNLQKDKGENYLRLKVTTDKKNEDVWVHINEVDFMNELRPLEINKLEVLYNKPKQYLSIKLNQEKIRLNLSEISPQENVGIWGINPVKFYTSNRVIERISSSTEEQDYRIEFLKPELCLN